MEIKTAFIGLGVMGYPMAGHLANSGYPVTVFNRTGAKAQQWAVDYSGQFALTPKDASLDAKMVFMCVGNDDDVRSVVYGEEGILAGLQEGDILVDHTTTSAQLALELAETCEKVGVQFIDAPVSGGQAGAENGKLTIMCGGDTATFAKAEPVMQSYAQQVQLLGKNGQGQRCKMVNQICIAGVLQGLSEALILAETAGLSIPQVVNTLQHGAAGSWQMVNRLETMAEDKFDFGFAIDWMRKDLGICLDEAKTKGVSLPLTEDVDQKYKALQEQGMGRMDTSVLVRALKKS
ncbi:NAD(P)-dependent oxidoreductase [Marinomonas transparens]|uniref:NAD(P)-dependent oxidoreductase n=1 Tax=Marinomonas transparens TaxID=2795388 RepID=A0A934JKV0_9GAMM|nr:NAD(P)-dependent oxidoreductase [Marinomonas transparens]MBJ7536233.1 NAD(P)-dependent oxidoreductase [Marinomonas transparens]